MIATEKTHVQGNMMTTGNALDLAIGGDGFFRITQADGTFAYTRDGSFKVSATGQVVTANGSLLDPAINLPEGLASLTVGQDGTVTAELSNGGGQSDLGQILIYRFVNPAGLQAMGQNLLRETAASGGAQPLTPGQGGAGNLYQGTLEASNVTVVEEMVTMIDSQRA